MRVLFSPALHTGASTPHKRSSKCTMEKVGGAFLQKLGGSALIINELPLSFCKNAMINFSEGIRHDGHNLMFHFLKSS